MPRTDSPSANPIISTPANHRRAAIGVAVVLTTQLMLALDTSVVNVALPKIQAGLHFDVASLSWVVNAYVLAYGGLLLLGGKLGDILGRRRVFAAGVAVFAVSSLLGGLATSPAWLETARAVQGAGAALAAPGVLALITANALDDAARHRGLAPFAAFSMGGNALGLVLGGVVTGFLSWRWTLFINVPIAAVVLTLLRRFVDETPRRRERFDILGAIAAAGTSSSLVFAIVSAPRAGWTSPLVIGGILLSAVLLAGLIVTERQVSAPLLWLGLLANRSRVVGLLVSVLAMGAQIAMFYFAVQYLQRVLHLSPVMAGVAFLPETAGIFVMTRFVPALVRTLGPRPVLVTAMAGLAASYAWFAFLPDAGTYWGTILAPLTLNGLAAGITFMPSSALALTAVDPARAGSAAGLLQTAQQLGGAIGLAVLVSVYAAFAHTGAFTPGLAQAFAVAAAFAVTALAAVVLLLRRG
jgi:EmrB/QacA subfamily drug resistance transporter